LFGFSARLDASGVSVAVDVDKESRVAVGKGLGVAVGLGTGVSVAGAGVGVLVAGGVTNVSSLPILLFSGTSGYAIDLSSCLAEFDN
jgi:hypothetical protein